ncbi:MAG: acyl carrier protein [Desulfuromonadaceae bacterium]|nr:acyl carrier protein [Desulfuromonadaceae bacterium]
MTEQEVVALINSSLAEEFELELEDMDADADIFDDFGLDSLDIVDMVIVLESAFKFKIREEQAIRKIRKLGEIHTFVLGKLNETEQAS